MKTIKVCFAILIAGLFFGCTSTNHKQSATESNIVVQLENERIVLILPKLYVTKSDDEIIRDHLVSSSIGSIILCDDIRLRYKAFNFSIERDTEKRHILYLIPNLIL